MRILSISKSTGGMAFYNARLCKRLNEFEDLDLHVICLSENNEHYAQELRDAGVTATTMAMDRYSINPMGDMRLTRQIQRFINDEQFDVMMAHGAKAGFIARLIERLSGPPAIYVLHSLPFLKRVQGRKAHIYRFLERGASALGGEIVAITHSQREALIEHHIATTDRISVIHTGVDTQKFNARKDRTEACHALGLDPERPVVGWAARMMPQKGPLDFVQVAAKIANTMPDVQFFMAGDGELKSDVMQSIEQLGLQETIHLAPWQEDVIMMLSAFDVFMMTSHWEGLPLSLLEAMAVGSAVVATAVDGIPEVIHHGAHGYLAEVNDIDNLAAHTLKLLQDSEQRSQMQQAAQTRIQDAFTFEYMIDQWYSYLTQVSNRKS